VILLTAKSSTDTQIESYQLGADAFVVKPFDLNHLSVLIEKNLEFASLQTRVRLLPSAVACMSIVNPYSLGRPGVRLE